MADTPSGALREEVPTSSSQSSASNDEAAAQAKKPRARRTRATTEGAQEAAAAEPDVAEAPPARRRRSRSRSEVSGEADAGAAPVANGVTAPQAPAEAPATRKSSRSKARSGDAPARRTRSARARPSDEVKVEATAEGVEAGVEGVDTRAPAEAAPEGGAQPTDGAPAEVALTPAPFEVPDAPAEVSGAAADEHVPMTPQSIDAEAPVASAARPGSTEEALGSDRTEGRNPATDDFMSEGRAASPRREEVAAEDVAAPEQATAEPAALDGSPAGEVPNGARDRSERPSRSRREEPPARRIREDGELPHDRLDEDAVKVVTRLHQFGHEAYLVGGCVRDLLLDRAPKDFDVATSATPNEVRGIFRNCRLIGRRFRLAHVYFRGGKVIEVSTFRANPTELEANGNGNGETEEAPSEGDLLITHDNVFGTAEEDARRRDFTMNGLFYDVEEGKVIDFVRGRRDLDRREIRTIGDPEVRMREDPVRILRAVRFANKLGLDLESRTYAAMEGAVEDLVRCAPARLLEETFRLLRGGYAEGSLKLLNALDALRILLPPLGEALREGGRDAEERCWAFAHALDEVVRSGEEVEDSLLLAALLIPITGRAPVEEDAEHRQTMSSEVEALLAELVQGARLPRRIAERARHLLFAQQILSGERRRRGGQASFRRHPIYGDALRLFEMTVKATGEHREALDAWKAGSAPGPSGGEGSSRPRRQRRPRRRGGQGGGAPTNGGEG